MNREDRLRLGICPECHSGLFKKMVCRRCNYEIPIEDFGTFNSVYPGTATCLGCQAIYDATDPAHSASELCHDCWWQDADVTDRVDWLSRSDTTHIMVANEASRAGNPRSFLLEYISDPMNSYIDRCEAEHILSGAVTTRELIDAQVSCPDCLEGVAFSIDKETGDVTCGNCGRDMNDQRPESVEVA